MLENTLLPPPGSILSVLAGCGVPASGKLNSYPLVADEKVRLKFLIHEALP